MARRVVGLLAARTDLAASLLAGSAAAGTSDEHSDIDLLNYYGVLPGQAAFDLLMRELGAEPEGAISPPGPHGFSGRYQLDGVEVQTGAKLVAEMDRQVERIAGGEVDWADAKVAMGLLEGLPLHGEQVVRRWQERARYPEPLRRREVEANLGVFAIWAIDDHLAARDAELFRRQMLLDGAFRVVAILLHNVSVQARRCPRRPDEDQAGPPCGTPRPGRQRAAVGSSRGATHAGRRDESDCAKPDAGCRRRCRMATVKGESLWRS
jgi:hypothetical protein